MEISGDHKTSEDGAIGNTKIRPTQLLSWFFTLNNYTEEDIKSLTLKFEEICDRYIFEKEEGSKNNVPHLQGVIFLKKKMRWSEFNLTNRIKWLKTKNEDAAIKYCQKDFHYEGRDVYYKGITLIRPDEIPIKSTWILYIENLVKDNILDKRKVHWFWSQKGEFGKTTLIKYLYERYKDVNVMVGSKPTANNILNWAFHCRGDTPIFILNIPRSSSMNREGYIAIESIKDGILTNFKSYENKTKMIRRPIIIVFANYAPLVDDKYLSKDRFSIHQIDFMEEVKYRGQK